MADALITGASSGIGADLARELHGRGHHVVLVARRADRLEELSAQLGARTSVLPADLSRPQERAALPERVAKLGLAIDILVNNAGLGAMGAQDRTDPDIQLNLIEVNVAALVDLCIRFVGDMVRRGHGSVLNVASVGAFGPFPGGAVYGASKAFVLSYTHALRAELRGTGVSATTLCPGPVHTGFGEQAGFPDAEAEKLLPKPLWVSAREVARIGVEGMAAGKAVVIPGRLNRVAAAMSYLTPRRLLLPLLARGIPGLTR